MKRKRKKLNLLDTDQMAPDCSITVIRRFQSERIVSSHSMMTGLSVVRFLVAKLLLFLLCLRAARCDLLSSSTITTCVSSDASKTDQVNCSQKLVLLLSITNGKVAESDSLEAFTTLVRDNAGIAHNLTTVFRIQVEKGEVYVEYPLFYKKNYNHFPHEIALVAPNCLDGANEDLPSCRWAHDYKTAEWIKDSQGFCCLCTFRDKLPKWLGGTHSIKRFNVKCSWTELINFLPWSRNGSAHCLRLDNIWYPTFGIEEGSLTFSIKVIIDRLVYNPQTANYDDMGITEELAISPSSPWAINQDRSVKIKLQGDFAAYTQFPVLSNRYLSAPYEANSQDLVTDYSRWLALDKFLYTENGQECNKIGVSYTPFKHQNSACAQSIQSCLANQLKNFDEEDQKRIEAGNRPEYAVTQYGTITSQQRVSF